MTKFIALSLATLMALPVFAAQDVTPDLATEQTVVDESAAPEALLPADQEQAENDEYRHRGYRPPHRPYPPHRPRPPRPNPPRPHPRSAYICYARDYHNYTFRYVDYDLGWARHGALRECNWRSPVGRCWLVGCNRY